MATPSVTSPIVVGASNALSGSTGTQSWGSVGVSARSWNGTLAQVIQTADGLGVNGGRFAGQLDYDPLTGASEALILNFSTPIDPPPCGSPA